MNIYESHIRQCFGRVVYAHKTHEKCADILTTRLNVVSNVQIILSAICTGGILSVFLAENDFLAEVVAAISSTLLTIVTLYFKQNDLAGTVQSHKNSASQQRWTGLPVQN